MFRSKYNPLTGIFEWQVYDEDTYDYRQEIARSGYGDMLHDTDRNVKYMEGLKSVLRRYKKQGKLVHVLDIGTGTGLLAMLAARLDADRVTACECFRPAYNIAKEIFELNGFSNVIRLIDKRSTDMTEADIGDRADICVAEVFDTELIGEGALRTFLLAHKHLLKKRCSVIPCRASVFVQLISSDFLAKLSKPSSFTLSGSKVHIQVPDNCSRCSGSVAVHDLQFDQLPAGCCRAISDAVKIFEFNFEDPATLRFDDSRVCNVKVNSGSGGSSRADAVLMWWELQMDDAGEHVISTQPRWMNEYCCKRRKEIGDFAGNIAAVTAFWRDHWMQGVYYFPVSLPVALGETVQLSASHDEFSFWFSVSRQENQEPMARPYCTCGLHTISSRMNLGRFNDKSRYEIISRALERVVNGKVSLSVSDLSLLPFIALQLGSKRVLSIESNQVSRTIIAEYVRANVKLDDSFVLYLDYEAVAESHEKIECVFGDPFFFSSFLPWHQLRFWHVINYLRIKDTLSADVKILPGRAALKCLAVDLKHLWKIRCPVKNVMGFRLDPFDAVIQDATDACDPKIEAHPMWEYDSKALSYPTELMEFDLSQPVPRDPFQTSRVVRLCADGTFNAVILWLDWEFGDSQNVVAGLREHCSPGQSPPWDFYSQFGVYFLREPFVSVKEGSDLCAVVQAAFLHEECELSLAVEIAER